MELKTVIEQAQAGDEKAKEELVKAMVANNCMRQLSRYLYRNRLLSADDVKSEFWLGVVQAMPVVRHDIGNPLQFLTWKGLCQVKNALRHTISTGVCYQCLDCGRIGRYRRDTDEIHCGRCDSINLQTQQIEVVIEDRVGECKKHKLQEELDITNFKQFLSERELDLVGLMLDGTDRDNAQNYIEDLSILLGISMRQVEVYIRTIRLKWRMWDCVMNRL